jgi:hypothetical protein
MPSRPTVIASFPGAPATTMSGGPPGKSAMNSISEAPPSLSGVAPGANGPAPRSIVIEVGCPAAAMATVSVFWTVPPQEAPSRAISSPRRPIVTASASATVTMTVAVAAS